MDKRSFLGALSLAAAVGTTTAAPLTETETRWLEAATPVLNYALQQHLPLDVIVQPQPQPGASPLAMAYVNGRCRLVLSMRGNSQPAALLKPVPATLQAAVIEAMAAHEVAHCWRYVRGAWNTLPDGFIENTEDDSDRARQWRDMQRTRREEGFADLAGLAWTLEHHPDRYAEVHAWLEGVRADPEVPGSHHDTRAWVRLSQDAASFAPGATPFERAWSLWMKGLVEPD